jgi:glycosyltransferase involved in cell wall biosynthesis
MITVLIVVSWNGHHPSYCAEMIRACDGFSRRIYVVCPAGANPLERVGGPAALLEKTSVLVHSNRASKTGFKKFANLAEDFRELRSQLTAIAEANPTDKLFIFHTSLDCLCIGVLQLPLLALRIRRLLPWPFGGLLLAPDRRWVLNEARTLVARYLGNPGRNAFSRALNSISNQALSGAAFLLRGYYLWLRDLMLRRSRCAYIAIQDERYAQRLQARTRKRVVRYPETTSVQVSDPPPELVKVITERRQGRVVVGLLGRVSRMKCLDLLLDAIREYDTRAFLFVVAGSCQYGTLSAKDRAFLEDGIKKHSNVVFSPKSIPSEADFNAIVVSCDIIYAVYRDHWHSSNVISKAVAFRKPVLVSDGELMAKRVRDYGIGYVLPAQTAGACFRAMQTMRTREYLQGFQSAGQFEKYMADNSFERLRELMVSLSSIGCSRPSPT